MFQGRLCLATYTGKLARLAWLAKLDPASQASGATNHAASAVDFVASRDGRFIAPAALRVRVCIELFILEPTDQRRLGALQIFCTGLPNTVSFYLPKLAYLHTLYRVTSMYRLLNIVVAVAIQSHPSQYLNRQPTESPGSLLIGTMAGLFPKPEFL